MYPKGSRFDEWACLWCEEAWEIKKLIRDGWKLEPFFEEEGQVPVDSGYGSVPVGTVLSMHFRIVIENCSDLLDMEEFLRFPCSPIDKLGLPTESYRPTEIVGLFGDDSDD